MGAATARIMCAAAPFVPNAFVPNVSFELNDRRTFQIGRFSITPYLVDHSAYDAYALLIQAAAGVCSTAATSVRTVARAVCSSDWSAIRPAVSTRC
ncbi:hypothetical protein ABIF65_008534 [Bradyrhizobium japonicum]